MEYQGDIQSFSVFSVFSVFSIFSVQELSFCHEGRFSSPFIFSIQYCRPNIFQTMRSNYLIMKYQSYTPSGCKNIEIINMSLWWKLNSFSKIYSESVRYVDLYKLMCVQGAQSREVLQLVLQRTLIFKQLILYKSLQIHWIYLYLSYRSNYNSKILM